MRSVVAVLWIAAALVSGRASAEEQGATPEGQPTTVPQKAAPAKKRWQPGRWWLAVGLSSQDVERSARNCGSGQIAVGFGRRAFAKLQHSAVTYEVRDSECGTFFGGGTFSILETALLVGVSAPSSGVFVALGPARSWFSTSTTFQESSST